MATSPTLSEAYHACQDLGYDVAPFPIADYVADELQKHGYEERFVAYAPNAFRRYVLNRRAFAAPLAYITFRADELPRFD